MSFSQFVGELLETGRVRVERPGPLAQGEEAEADERLVAFERDFRRELPGEAPPFSLAAGRFGALAIYHACQFLVFRDADAEMVRKTLEQPSPNELTPASAANLATRSSIEHCSAKHYGVDLVLRFLPDVARLAQGINPADPLVEQLRRLGSRWPLSSVGMKDVAIDAKDSAEALTKIFDHPCLAAMYVDRVIARRDVARLGNPRVREAVQAAIGWHQELAPEIAAALRPQTTPDTQDTPDTQESTA